MRLRRDVSFVIVAAASLLLGAVSPLSATAQQSSSTNYQVNDVYFGAGGDLNDCSTNYCAKEALGETGVGNTKSTSYQAQAGFNTDRNPYLVFSITGGSVNLGVLSVGSTAVTTATFSVKSYNSSGYIVQIASTAPIDTAPGHHILNPLAAPTASAAGTEQFGMNLVANTSPTTFGAGPVQVPSSSYSFGQVSSGYNTPNLYKYVNGDTVAYSNTSTGETDYTASYIYNISGVTPDGEYTFSGVLVATATF